MTCSGKTDWLSKKLQTVEAREATFPNKAPSRWCEGRELSCWDPTFLSHFCSTFPVVVVKTVRAPLATAVPLLQVIEGARGEGGQVGAVDRVLVVVRDPRGTMASRSAPITNHDGRRKMWWCTTNDCADLDRYCRELENTFHKFASRSVIIWPSAQLPELRRAYPGQVAALRYDELLLNPEMVAKKVLSWAELEWTAQTQKYVLSRTRRNLKTKSPYSTYESPSTNDWMKSGEYHKLSNH